MHFWLKFNHGVEIGARLAYEGHFDRTRDGKVFEIILDELEHKRNLQGILWSLGHESSETIDSIFRFIGGAIRKACRFAPIWSLNLVARSMEMFAVYNYERLAVKYPKFRAQFLKMAAAEREHQHYFSK